MKRMMIGLLIIGLAIGFVCSISGASEKVEELIFYISVDKESYTIGEAIYCTMVLANKSKVPLIVNDRFLVNYDETFPHEVLFTVTGPEGKKLPFEIIVRAGLPQKEYFKELEPGEFTLRRYELSWAYNFNEEGEYTIQAIYENNYQPEGILAWKGKLKSNIINIKVVK